MAVPSLAGWQRSADPAFPAPPGIALPAAGCQLSSSPPSCSSFFLPASSASYLPLTALGQLPGTSYSGEVGSKGADEEY